MVNLLTWPFELIWGIVKLFFSIVMLPFKILLGMIGFTVGLLAFVIKVGLWLLCIYLAVMIGQSRGLHPLLCAALAAFLGPIGLLIVFLMAMFRPAQRV